MHAQETGGAPFYIAECPYTLARVKITFPDLRERTDFSTLAYRSTIHNPRMKPLECCSSPDWVGNERGQARMGYIEQRNEMSINEEPSDVQHQDHVIARNHTLETHACACMHSRERYLINCIVEDGNKHIEQEEEANKSPRYV